MCVETKKLLAAQSAVGVALRGSGITLKVLAANAKLNLNSVSGYFPADAHKTPVQLPGGALFALIGVLPDDLMDLLLPDGFKLVRAPAQIDVHEIGRVVAEIAALKNAAHHPDSPDGVEISDCEARQIAGKVAELQVVS